MPGELTPAQSGRLMDAVAEQLRTARLPRPKSDEKETLYTRRYLQPLMRTLLEEIGHPGLLLAGSGEAPIHSAFFLGSHFYPDIGVSYFGQHLVAIEVKLLRHGVPRQNAIATALGQATLYKHAGYAHVGLFLLDLSVDRIRDDEIRECQLSLEGDGVVLIVRRARYEDLLPHPA